LLKGNSGGTVEPRAAGAWLSHSLAAEARSQIRLSDPADEVLVMGVTLPSQG
jgi:histidine phosphotransferase ChpT